MKWIIASDIHGASAFCEELINAFHAEKADKMLLLGDLLYHGPRNDLPDRYEPKSVINQLNALAGKIVCVRGNCDTEVDQQVLEFPIMADYALIDVGERLVFATHGHKFSYDSPPLLAPGDILLHGHTHIPACEKKNGFVYCNPGSVSIPKGGSKRSYMTLDNSTFYWKDFEGNTFNTFVIE